MEIFYLQSERRLVIGVGHPLLNGSGVDGPILKVWELSVDHRLCILAWVPQRVGLRGPCSVCAAHYPSNMPPLSSPHNGGTQAGSSGRGRPVLLHVGHRDHSGSAFLVSSVPPLFLRLLQHTQDVTLAEGEVLLIVAREVKQRPDKLCLLGLLRDASRGADEACVLGLAYGLYECGCVQVVDLIKL